MPTDALDGSYRRALLCVHRELSLSGRAIALIENGGRSRDEAAYFGRHFDAPEIRLLN